MKIDISKMDRAFNPRSVVVVGDRKETGFRWLSAQRAYKGKLYSVQTNPLSHDSIQALGINNFTSLLQVPDPVDLVIVAVPRTVVPEIIQDCIKKDVAAAHIFTAGYSETGTDEGKEMESQLARQAEEANLHLIGPNCMGIFNPAIGLKQDVEEYVGVSGPVAMIGQSGTHTTVFATEAHLQGLNIGKSVSFGNGTVLDVSEYLEYFGQDPTIKVIGMYLEGVRNGRKFFRVLKEVATRKPVVIWKGGWSDAGARSIASHTGSMAIPQMIWDSVIRQCGAVKVLRMQELIDTLKALVYLPPIRGNRVALAGGSGGQGVVIGDIFTDAGLSLPVLSQKSHDEFSSFFSIIGHSFCNPIDTGFVNLALIKRALYIVEQDPIIDNIGLLVTVRFSHLISADANVQLLMDIKQKTTKPVFAILACEFSPEEVKQAGELIQKFHENGIPAFTSIEGAATGLKGALGYYRRRDANSQ